MNIERYPTCRPVTQTLVGALGVAVHIPVKAIAAHIRELAASETATYPCNISGTRLQAAIRTNPTDKCR
jgi:hypothetical protein